MKNVSCYERRCAFRQPLPRIRSAATSLGLYFCVSQACVCHVMGRYITWWISATFALQLQVTCPDLLCTQCALVEVSQLLHSDRGDGAAEARAGSRLSIISKLLLLQDPVTVWGRNLLHPAINEAWYCLSYIFNVWVWQLCSTLKLMLMH